MAYNYPASMQSLAPLTKGLPPILILSVSDNIGAFWAAAEHHRALLAAGANVKTLTLRKTRDDEGIVEIPHSKKYSTINKSLLSAALRSYPNHPGGYEIFTLAKSPVSLDSCGLVKNAGLVHLHWTSGLVGWPDAHRVLQNKCVVWKNGDMNPFTGGCHYAAGCEKWKTGGCRDCPQLGPSSDGRDLAAQNFAAKQAGYEGLNITVVTAGKWLGKCARESLLLGRYHQHTIPNAIDFDEFEPVRQDIARRALNLPLQRKIICFGANGVHRRNKGFHLLVAALQHLRDNALIELPLLLIIGHPPKDLSALTGYDIRMVGHITDRKRLAMNFSAADVFVAPSLQEAFGLVIAEAQSCGTPSIAFYNTGGEDIIQDGVTGHLAEHPGLPITPEGLPSAKMAYGAMPEQIFDLIKKIEIILRMPHDEYAGMRERSAKSAFFNYSPVLQTARYLDLYRNITGLPQIPMAEVADGLCKK